MFQSKVRAVGNSLVVTIPRKEAARLKLGPGQTVAVDVAAVETRLRLPFPEDMLAEMRRLTQQNRPVLLLLKD